MRFVKIFLASFFSLIGVIGIILGTMWVFGSFNRLIIEPKEIHFEFNEYFVDNDFMITINTTTENVDVKEIVLSLKNQIDEYSESGYITDKIIIIPEKVTLGVPFRVELYKDFNDELLKDWIKGGISELTAQPKSIFALNTTCKVYVDVPVESVNIKTYSNNTEHTQSTAFALGESFYAEAEFLPSESKYKYSTTEIKKVIFDITTNTGAFIALNETMTNEMINAGKPYIQGYDVLKISDEVVINAYTFSSAKVEDYYVDLGHSEDDLVRYMKQTSAGRAVTQDLTFTNRTVKGFQISQLNITNTLKFNDISYIYANNPAGALPNLGIVVSSSDNTSIQNKINDVGIRALVRDSGVYREATQQEIIFTENNRVEFGENSSGEGQYYRNAGGQYLPLSAEVPARYSFNGTIYSLNHKGAYYKVGDNYILITETYGLTYDKYYLPTLVPVNVDNSYWSVIALNESLNYYFEVRIFEKNDVIQTPITTLYTYNTSSKWISESVVLTDLSWKNEQPVELIFIDSANSGEKDYEEYNLSDNLEMSNPNSTYTLIKYLAFTTDSENVDSIIQNVQPASNYDLTGYNIPYALFEINGNILKSFGAGSVCVVGVIIKTDYLGRPILDENGKYVIFAITKPTSAIKSYQELVVNIDKTIQNLNAEVTIKNASILKNVPEEGGDINKLAFIQNEVVSVFTVDITITADEHTNIQDEISLFVNAWNQHRIYLRAYTLSGLYVDDILFFEQNMLINSASGVLVGLTWTLPVNVYSLSCNADTELYIKLFYEKTPEKISSTFITKVNLPAELSDVTIVGNATYIKIEVYDGKAYSAGFAVVTDSNNPVEKSVSISQGAQIEPNKYYASEINSAYMLGGEDITDTILDENGAFIIKFYDKYGNEIQIPATDYSVTSNQENKVLNVTNYSSSLLPSQLPLTSTLHINETDEGSIVNIEYNEGAIYYGAFEAKYVDITSEYLVNNNYIAKITRYGAGGSAIQILGAGGLLRFEYIANDGNIYQLENVINYNFTTLNWQSTYSGYLSLSGDNTNISVLKTTGADIILNIIADTGLGIVIYIELTIKSNISSTYEVVTIQTGAGGDSDIQQNFYYGIYSDNNVDIEITFKMVLYETFVLSYLSNAETQFLFDNGSILYTINNILEIVITLTVQYNFSELGMKTILLRTDTGAYDYSRTIYLNVNANLELSNAEEGNIVEKSIEFSAPDTVVPVLTSDDYQRIVGNKVISLASVTMNLATISDGSIEHSQVFFIHNNGSFEITDNIFTVQGFGIMLNSNATLAGSYLVILNVEYGGVVIGQIYLNISTDMKANTLNPSYNEYFADYNGKTYLVLVSLNQYDLIFISFLFDNVNSVYFNPTAMQNVYQIVDLKVIVDNLYTYTSGYYLNLSNSVGTITYPVLFSPLKIGFLKYDETSAENTEATATANSDIGYLLDKNYLINNNVSDVYNSGTESSLLNVNYTLELDEDIYTFKNFRTESVYLLAHITGAGAGYYYYKIDGINVLNTTYNFSLNTLSSSWTLIQNVNIISPTFRSPNPGFLGVFSENTEFTEITLIEQNKPNGLSLDMYNNSSTYSYRIIDENANGTVNFNSLTTSSFASYTHNKAILKTESLTENNVVWLLVLKSDQIVLAYRISIIANSGLNIYYPHGTGTGTSAGDGVLTDEAEYVYFKTAGDITIDFNQNIASSLPNSTAGINIKRVMFQYGNETIGWTNASNYTLNYSIHKISVNGVEIKSTDPGASALFASYLTLNAQNKLIIKHKHTNEKIVIYVKVTAQIDGQPLNATVYYKVFVNYSAINYALYYLDAFGEISDNKFTQTSAEIDYGDLYDFSVVALVNKIDSTLVIMNGLKYHYYSAEGKDLSDYINLDIENKTISINSGIELVSDLKVHLIMYTMFGTLIDIELTFKSSINFEYNSAQSTVIYNSQTKQYEVYSDIMFDLTQIFYLETGGASIPVNVSYWQYSLDNGQTYLSGNDVIFDQSQSGVYQVFIKVLLSQYDGITYKDDYFTTITLKIKDSIISNYPEINTPMLLAGGMIEYPTDSFGSQEFEDLIYVQSATISENVLFSVQNVEILDRYTISMQIIDGNEYISTFSLDIETNTFTLQFNSPADIVDIWLAFTLSNGDYSITSYLRFKLKPDVQLNINYPSPDGITTYNSEAAYLSGGYINNSNLNDTYSYSSGNYAVRFNQTMSAYFKTTRIEFKNNSGQTVNYAALLDRVVITVSSISNNLVASFRKDASNVFLNTNIDLNAGALLSSNINFQWVGTASVLTSTTGTVTFAIYLDGVHRGFYTIIFHSDMRDIFRINVNPHNQIIDYGEGINAEVFFVENENSGRLFSNSDALLTFTLRGSYASLLAGNTASWSFYLGFVNENTLLESITLNSTSSLIQVVLSAQEEITFENLIVLIGGNEYVFDSSAQNSIFISYVNISAGYNLTHRATAYYLGTEISYSNYAEIITFDTVNASDFVINKSNINAINKATPIEIAVGGVTFATYYYTLIYDFKINPNTDAEHYTLEIPAGTEITSLLDTFSVTRYNGNKFTGDYFTINQNTLDAQVIMITDSDYETTNSTDNIKYLNSNYIKYYKPEYLGISTSPEFSNYIDYVNISPLQLQSNSKTYNFALMANGAENSGNYVYIIITFKANQITTDLAYAVIKIFVQPVWTEEFYNEDQNANDEENPFIIYYDGQSSNHITPIILSDVNYAENHINIYRGGDFNKNYAVSNGYFKYIIQGELISYLKLDELYKTGDYYINSLQIKNGTNTAIYGNKSGYIEISDAYGYVMRYYITLIAQSDESLSYANQIINATGADLFEGSTISIVDVGYNQDTDRQISTNYALKINNLQQLINNGYTYKITYLINGVTVESYNNNPESSDYNTGKITVQKASFYTTTTGRQPVILKIQLEISKGAYSETVIINAGINIVKRYTVNGSGNTYVRDNVPFNVSDYIYVSDANISADIGEITLSDKQFTLVVPEAFVGSVITVSASQGETKINRNIIIGEDSLGNNKDAAYGNYYYPLKEISAFKDLNFNLYKFTVVAVSLPSNAGIYLSKKMDNSFDASGQLVTEQSSTQFFFYNSFSNSMALVYTTGTTYYYKTFVYGRNETISTAAIPSSWTITTEFGGATEPGFVGIYSADLSTEYTGAVYGNNDLDYEHIVTSMRPDKLLSVVTLDLQSETEEIVRVVLNNQQYQAFIPFELNFDGVQTTSVYEAILKWKNGVTTASELNNIIGYEKDSQVMSVEDLQKLKGIRLYNDTVSLKIVGGLAGTIMNVRVYYSETQYKSKIFTISNNNPHYYYFSLNSILGDSLGLNVDVDYKIEISYTLINIESGDESGFANSVTLFDNFANSITYVYNSENSYCTYTITVNAFEISQLTPINGLYADCIDVMHSGDFVNKIKANVKKYYLVQYAKDNVIYSVTVNYNVTPQYYLVDTSGNASGNNYKIIYNGQYVRDDTEDAYEIDFERWTAGFNLLDYNSNKIKSVTSAEDDLYFEIQTTTSTDGGSTSTGAAYLDQNNKIITTEGFNAEQHYIKVSVYTYVDKIANQKVFIGNIYLKIDSTSLFVSVPGNYNVTINSPEIGSTIYKINTPYQFTANTAKIADIVSKDNENMASVVNDNNEIGFFTGNSYVYKEVNDCDFSVVSVISSIDESVFEDGRLSIKINLNETQNSINQRLEMQATALPKSTILESKTSNSFFLYVDYIGGVYYLKHQNQAGDTIDTFTKGEDGYFNVRIKLEDIFNEIFVGSDYTYKINVISVANEIQSDSLSVIYADNSFIASTNDTVFFQLSYVEGGLPKSKFIGLKYTTENQTLAGPLGYAIDLEKLGAESLLLKNCTISFLGSFALDCADGEQNINLLLSYGSLDYDMTYSIGFIETYSESDPFWFIDYAKSMLSFASATQTFVKRYEFAVVNDAPTYLLLESNEGANDRYYGVYSGSGIDLYGISPVDGLVILKVSDYTGTINKVSIKNYNQFIIDSSGSGSVNVSELFGVGVTSVSTYWQSNLYGNALFYTKTNITKQTNFVNYDSQLLSQTQYKFDYAPGYWQNGTANVYLIEGTMSFTALVSSITNDKSYYFKLNNTSVINASAVIKGAELGNVDILAILNNFLPNFSGTARIRLLNINGLIDEIGLQKYAVFNNNNLLVSIRTATFQSLAGTNYFLTNDDILTTYSKALKVGDIYNYTVPFALQMTYYKLTDETGNVVYYAMEANQTTTIQINCENLVQGDTITFNKYDISLPINSLNSPLFLVVPLSQYAQSYAISSQTENFSIIIPAHTTLVEINLNDYFTSAPIELTITAEN